MNNDKVFLIKGLIKEILENIHSKGYENLYIDGGKNIQNFLESDLIDEMIITTIPILLGEGTPLFAHLTNRLNFECISSSVEKGIAQSHYKRKRKI
ncbi:MAG: dihydrofolate reductase family protein [Poseidonibacter sp.]|uniref:dihydrofolate reductase family protein n=1 Tax=Poseidonibacter sp. TaxID=2321188 RepID=UPI00359D0354